MRHEFFKRKILRSWHGGSLSVMMATECAVALYRFALLCGLGRNGERVSLDFYSREGSAMSTPDKKAAAFLQGKVDAYESILGSLSKRQDASPLDLIFYTFEGIRESRHELGLSADTVDRLLEFALERAEAASKHPSRINMLVGSC